MMRHGGLADAQPLSQFAHAEAGAFLRGAAVPLAAAREAEKDREPVRMRQGLEREDSFFDVHISIVLDISHHVKARKHLALIKRIGGRYCFHHTQVTYAKQTTATAMRIKR
jgi:hypothetical protein